jgi:hypothetical protein
VRILSPLSCVIAVTRRSRLTRGSFGAACFRWQAQIRGRFPSPLVQPHRKLLLDGPLTLVAIRRRTTHHATLSLPPSPPTQRELDGDLTIQPPVRVVVPYEVITHPQAESMPLQLVGILTSDVLVLCECNGDGKTYQLYTVARLQTMTQPASIVGGSSESFRLPSRSNPLSSMSAFCNEELVLIVRSPWFPFQPSDSSTRRSSSTLRLPARATPSPGQRLSTSISRSPRTTRRGLCLVSSLPFLSTQSLPVLLFSLTSVPQGHSLIEPNSVLDWASLHLPFVLHSFFLLFPTSFLSHPSRSRPLHHPSHLPARPPTPLSLPICIGSLLFSVDDLLSLILFPYPTLSLQFAFGLDHDLTTFPLSPPRSGEQHPHKQQRDDHSSSPHLPPHPSSNSLRQIPKPLPSPSPSLPSAPHDSSPVPSDPMPHTTPKAQNHTPQDLRRIMMPQPHSTPTHDTPSYQSSQSQQRIRFIDVSRIEGERRGRGRREEKGEEDVGGKEGDCGRVGGGETVRGVGGGMEMGREEAGGRAGGLVGCGTGDTEDPFEGFG